MRIPPSANRPYADACSSVRNSTGTRRTVAAPSTATNDLPGKPAQRRHGVGAALVRAAEDWAGRRGLSAIQLRPGGQRADAHTFYRALGYTERKTQLSFGKRLVGPG
jgi:GNAT superfamily N-acetyltransferase